MKSMEKNISKGAIRVLHVDDSLDYLLLARYRLKKLADELAIEWAESGTDALNALDSGSYNCIVCDMHMPDMDGLKLLELVRDRGDSTPFIFLSANDDNEIAEKIMNSGAHGYCSKEVGQGYFMRLLDNIRKAAQIKESVRG